MTLIKGKKPVAKVTYCMIPIIRRDGNRQIHGKGTRISGCRGAGGGGGWGRGGKGSDYLMDTGVLGGREILKLEKGGGYTAL